MMEVTQLQCTAAIDGSTHHLAPRRHGSGNVHVCVYCHLTAAEIHANEEAGMHGVKVATWADGFGVWHCKVTMSASVKTPEFKSRARAAIRAEILARENHAPGGLRLELVQLDDMSGRHGTVTKHFKEKV